VPRPATGFRAALAHGPGEVDSRHVRDTEHRNPYAGGIEDLERAVQVPIEQQSTDQPVSPAPGFGTDWDEQARILRLAGGA